MNKSGKWVRLMGLVGCTMWMASCQEAPTRQAGGASYETMTVFTSDKEFITPYSATIRGRYDANILPQVSGTIQKVMVSEGQKVSKGQSLFIIDQVPYRAALNTASANVQAAKAGLATAQLSYDSAKELYAQKVISEHQLKTTENTLLTVKAQLAQAEAQEVNAKNNLAYTEVKSPSDGVVGALPMREGTLVSEIVISESKDDFALAFINSKVGIPETIEVGDLLELTVATVEEAKPAEKKEEATTESSENVQSSATEA